MENDTQKLAERIANFLGAGEREANDFASLRASIEQIDKRLFAVENNLNANDALSDFRAAPSFHPSLEKFEIAEAYGERSAQIGETEKPCPFEPTGKPCDHCSMCNSRGF